MRLRQYTIGLALSSMLFLAGCAGVLREPDYVDPNDPTDPRNIHARMTDEARRAAERDHELARKTAEDAQRAAEEPQRNTPPPAPPGLR